VPGNVGLVTRERCRRAPGFRPIAAGLVKIGLPPVNVGLSSSSNAARRVCAESAPGNVGLPACPYNPTFSIPSSRFPIPRA